jgi:hypothetical protein
VADRSPVIRKEREEKGLSFLADIHTSDTAGERGDIASSVAFNWSREEKVSFTVPLLLFLGLWGVMVGFSWTFFSLEVPHFGFQ